MLLSLSFYIPFLASLAMFITESTTSIPTPQRIKNSDTQSGETCLDIEETRSTENINLSMDDSDIQSGTCTATAERRGAEIGDSRDILREIFVRLPLFTLQVVKSISPGLIGGRKFWERRAVERGLIPPHSHTPACAILLLESNTPHEDIFEVINLDRSLPTIPPFPRLNISDTTVWKPNRTTHKCTSRKITTARGITHSCNGLFLLHTYEFEGSQDRYGSDKELRNRRYYVFNPTTNLISSVIPKLYMGYFRQVLGTYLIFDPSVSSEYQIVCIQRYPPSCQLIEPAPRYWEFLYQINIYSSKTLRWRFSARFRWHNNIPFSRFNGDYSVPNGVFCNNAIHWLADQSLYYYVVGEGQFHTIPLPELHDTVYLLDETFEYVGSSGGYLHVVFMPHPSHATVYYMEKNHSGWYHRYDIDLQPLKGAYPTATVTVLSLIEGADELFVVLYVPLGQVLLYYLETREFVKLCDVDHRPVNRWSWREVHQYIECYASVSRRRSN